MRMERITANKLESMCKYLNSLEFHVNPEESKRYVNGNMWHIDHYSDHGVYIRRGHTNPTECTNRMPVIQAYQFLCGIKFALEVQYQKLNNS